MTARLDDDEARTYWAAREHLLSICMAQVGLPFSERQYPPSGASASEVEWVYPDDVLVAQYGYNWRQTPDAGAANPDPSTTDGDRLGPPSSGSLEPTPGCADSAAEQLNDAEWGNAANLISAAQAEIVDAVLATPTMTALTTEWSNCMAQAGFTVTSFKDAQVLAAKIDQDRAVSTASPEAIAVAVTDFACQKGLNVLDTHRSLVSQANAARLEANPGAIETLAAARARLMSTAKQILG